MKGLLRYDWLSHQDILTEEIIKRRVREPTAKTQIRPSENHWSKPELLAVASVRIRTPLR